MARKDVPEVTEDTTIRKIIHDHSIGTMEMAWIRDLVIRHLKMKKGQIEISSHKTISQIAEENEVSDSDVQTLIQGINETIQGVF